MVFHLIDEENLAGWQSGLYFARLTAPGGVAVAFAPFVLRPAIPGTNRVAVIVPTYTWQAYNFYDANRDRKPDSWYGDATRRSVTLGRPFTGTGKPPLAVALDVEKKGPGLHHATNALGVAWRGADGAMNKRAFFLFALFLARPCPFYLLDEVEAALDDTNIGRFVELLRRYSDRAQFVVITHQKRTMEAADILYGVTMGGDGISQIVSRRLPREEAEAVSAA